MINYAAAYVARSWWAQVQFSFFSVSCHEKWRRSQGNSSHAGNIHVKAIKSIKIRRGRQTERGRQRQRDREIERGRSGLSNSVGALIMQLMRLWLNTHYVLQSCSSSSSIRTKLGRNSNRFACVAQFSPLYACLRMTKTNKQTEYVITIEFQPRKIQLSLYSSLQIVDISMPRVANQCDVNYWKYSFVSQSVRDFN